MTKHKWTVVLVIALVVLLPLYSVLFTVDQAQTAIIKTFGKAGAPISGETQAGLHVKWPWPIQELIRYDARIFSFEDTHEQLQTEDKQNVLVTVFCAWRIKHADQFLRSIRTKAAAEVRLRELVRSKKQDLVGKYPLSDFLNTDPDQMKLPQIEGEILDAVRKDAREQYGVEVVSLGIKSFGLPEKVTEAVIKSMVEERNRYAEEYRTQGTSAARLIKAAAETARDQIIAFTNALATEIRTEGERAAAEYYKEFEKNKELAIFLLELEFLRESLKENTTIVGTPALHRSLGYLKDGPSVDLTPSAKPKKD